MISHFMKLGEVEQKKHEQNSTKSELFGRVYETAF